MCLSIFFIIQPKDPLTPLNCLEDFPLVNLHEVGEIFRMEVWKKKYCGEKFKTTLDAWRMVNHSRKDFQIPRLHFGQLYMNNLSQ